VIGYVAVVILDWGSSFLIEPRHSRVGGNLIEVPAFAGMTLLRWGDVTLLG